MKKTLYILAVLLCCNNLYAEEHYVASVAKYTDSWVSIEGSIVTIPAEAGEYLTKINTNLDLKVSNRPFWLSPSFVDKTTLKLKATHYSGKGFRTGTITLKGRDMKSIAITVKQIGSAATASSNKSEIKFYSDKLLDSVLITSNSTYNIKCPEWITAELGEDGKCLFYAKKLYGESSRTGEISITDTEGKVFETISATQYYYDKHLYSTPRFAVISDIHFGDTNAGYWYNRAPKFLKTLDTMEPQLQYVFIVGDIGDRGQEEQYIDVKNYFNKYLRKGIKKIFIRGNHDWINGETGVKAFNTHISSTDNYYIDIEGYPFIAVGLDGTLYRGETINEETRNFVNNALKDAAVRYPDKPIFVFTHTLPRHTIIGSYDDGDYAAYDDNLDDMLRPYPQAIHFSGHTHMGIMDPHNIYQKYYTAVNDGSQKSDSHPTKFPGKNHYQASSDTDYYLTEGLVVYINDDEEVVMERWNTARGIKYDNDWIVSPPFNDTSRFKYTNARTGGKNPWWNAGAELKVTQKSSTECFIEIPHAVDDNEGVNRYIISVTNNAGTKVISDINQSALQYMGSDRPNTIKMLLQKLPTGVPLTISVVGRDYYELSTPALTNTITLK